MFINEMKKETIGHSVENRPIELYQLTQGPINILFLGGVHGDEHEGISIVSNYMERGNWKSLDNKASLYIVPQVNPDGCFHKTRVNANKVDLNRNMPTEDWTPSVAKERYHPGPSAGSEPETQVLMALVEKLKPRFILTAHSWNPMINYNGPCKGIAEHMAQYNKYMIAPYIGYPTPGSLGTWAGHERKIATITLEIEEDMEAEKAWSLHGDAIQAAFEYACEHEDLS